MPRELDKLGAGEDFVNQVGDVGDADDAVARDVGGFNDKARLHVAQDVVNEVGHVRDADDAVAIHVAEDEIVVQQGQVGIGHIAHLILVGL